MGDKNPKKAPKPKKAVEKVNKNLHSIISDSEGHIKGKK